MLLLFFYKKKKPRLKKQVWARGSESSGLAYTFAGGLIINLYYIIIHIYNIINDFYLLELQHEQKKKKKKKTTTEKQTVFVSVQTHHHQLANDWPTRSELFFFLIIIIVYLHFFRKLIMRVAARNQYPCKLHLYSLVEISP